MRKQLKLSEFKPTRISLPYGKWTSSDGTEVLFNRDYRPMWERPSGGITKMIAPDTYVIYDSSEHYYNDRTAPYYGNADTLEKCHKVLEEWGVTGIDNRLVQLMPAAIIAQDFRLLSPKDSS